MSEQNKALIRRFYEEVVNQKNPAIAGEIVTPDFDDHAAQAPGIDGFMKLFSIMTTVFPDLHVTVEDLIAEGDRVAARVEVRGTQSGSFRGFPPTDKQVDYPGMDIFRIKDGKIAERWTQRDFLGMLQKLGHI